MYNETSPEKRGAITTKRGVIAVKNAAIVSDENNVAAVKGNSSTAITGKTFLKGTAVADGIAYATRAVTKRQALVDVSNVQTKAALVGKTALSMKPSAMNTIAAASAADTKAKIVVPSISAVRKSDSAKENNVTVATAAVIKPSGAADSKRPAITNSIFDDVKARQYALIQEREEMLKKKKCVTMDWDDLDAEDSDDPMMASEYVQEVFEYLRQFEMKMLPDPNYINIQKELKWGMRSILFDWLVEVHLKLKLLPETLYLAVNLADRFLSLRLISYGKLQLVGITATMIASKYEEIVTPTIENFVYLTAHAFEAEEIIKAERYMLHVLEYVLGMPSPMNFLRRISKADNYDIRSRTLAKYLMEITILDEAFVACPPSLLAAAAMWLARRMLGSTDWNRNLVHYSGYSEPEIMPAVQKLIDFISKPSTHDTMIFKKYSSKKFMRAAVFVQEYATKHFGLVIPETVESHQLSQQKE